METFRKLILLAMISIFGACQSTSKDGDVNADLLWKGNAKVSEKVLTEANCRLPFKSPYQPTQCTESFYAIKGWDSVKVVEYEFADEAIPRLIHSGLGEKDRASYHPQGRWLWHWQAMTHYVFLPKEVGEFKHQLDPQGEYFKNFWAQFPLSNRTGDYSFSRDTLLGVPLAGDYYCVYYRQSYFDYRLCRGRDHIKATEFQGWINRFNQIKVGGHLPKLGTWYHYGDRLMLPMVQNDELWLVEGMVPLHYALSWINTGINLEE